nr:retrovirus-related Pol polyprotein from transposon TNT 1-94 [Tanacetum cinerariifolium]
MQTQTLNTLHNAIMEAGGKDRPPMLAPYKVVLVSEGSPETTTETYMENYKNVSQDIRDQLNVEAEAVQIILTWIDNDIYSTVDACLNACEMWKAIKRLKQGESINVQDLETNLYWEFGKFTSRDGESLESYYSRFYKMMNELVQNQYDVTNHQVNVHFLLQLQPEWQRENMLFCKQEEAGIQLNAEQADWRNDIDDESKDQELEVHYMYMTQIQEVSPDAADSGPIFDFEPLKKVSNDDHYNMFAIESKHPKQSKSVNDTYPIEQDEHNVIIDSLDMSYDREQIDQNDDDYDLANERELLASLIEKLQCEIDDRKNRNKFFETSNKVLVEKLKDKELDKVIALENKVKVLDNIVYKTGQSVQTMNMLNRNCKTSFAKPEFLKKAQRVNPRLYDVGFYNDNLALMLAFESNEVIRHEKESRSKLSDLIRPFDYEKLNNLYDLFVPQRKKSSAQRYFLETSKTSHTHVNNGNSKESFNKQTTLLEKRIDESIPYDQKCKSSKELFKIKRSVGTINFDTINLLSKNDIVIGLPKLKFFKDHLCSFCELGKAKRKSFQTKTTSSFKRQLQLLHMDLFGPTRVASINGKKYVLVIVDDYSRYTWTHFLRSKDETPEVLIDFLRLVQRGLHAQGFFTKFPLLEHLNKTALSKDGTVPLTALEHDSLSPGLQCQENVTHEAKTVTTSNEMDLLFSPMFAELLNGSSQGVSKSSAKITADAPNQRQQKYKTPLNTQTATEPTCQVPTQAPIIASTENITQAEMIAENAQLVDDEFINIFCTPIQERGETSSRHVDSLNMHTFYQRYPSEHCWTKDHPLEQVIGNPSQLVRTRC